MTTTTPTDVTALWKTVFEYLRLLQCPHHEAEDLTQEVFLRLTEKDFFEGRWQGFESHEEKRNYLFVMARNARCDRRRHASRLKRGGPHGEASLDALPDDGETSSVREHATPADHAQQKEAVRVVDRHLARLKHRASKQGKEALFAEVEYCLKPGHGPVDLREAATSLGLHPSSVRVQAFRWRQHLLEDVRATFAADLVA